MQKSVFSFNTNSYCPQPDPHVAIAVVDLLQELTDIDTLHESEEGAEVLIDALVSSGLPSVFDYVDEAALCGANTDTGQGY